MGFWKARACRFGGLAVISAFAFLLAASAASAVSVSLPTNAAIGSVGGTTPVTMSIGSVTNLEAVAVSFTYDNTIVTAFSVQAGTLVSTCSAPVANLGTPGRVTITLACTTAVSGSGSLFVINFQGAANGISALTFSPTMDVPNGCQLNEGTPTCESSDGQISVGPVAPTGTATATATSTPTNTPPSTATASSSATATGTQTSTPTVTDTPTVGPSPTPSQTTTASNTATVTQTPSVTLTPSQTATVTNTLTVTPTRTITNTRTVTPTRPGAIPVVPSPVSPAGLVLITSLGAALLFALRRLARQP